MQQAWPYIAGWYVLASGFAFALFGWDKRSARLGHRRVSERTLHTVELLGGWPGALAGSRLFRHKTQKTSYRIVFGLIVAAHVALWGYVLFKGR